MSSSSEALKEKTKTYFAKYDLDITFMTVSIIERKGAMLNVFPHQVQISVETNNLLNFTFSTYLQLTVEM